MNAAEAMAASLHPAQRRTSLAFRPIAGQTIETSAVTSLPTRASRGASGLHLRRDPSHLVPVHVFELVRLIPRLPRAVRRQKSTSSGCGLLRQCAPGPGALLSQLLLSSAAAAHSNGRSDMLQTFAGVMARCICSDKRSGAPSFSCGRHNRRAFCGSWLAHVR